MMSLDIYKYAPKCENYEISSGVIKNMMKCEQNKNDDELMMLHTV